MTKPIQISGFTQEQRNTCVAAAVKSKTKLNDWAKDILLVAAKSELRRCDKCGKTDFDYGKGCKSPSVFSPGVGDWICNEVRSE